MDDMNVRANEVEEIEIDTEIEEVEGSSNAGALLMGIVGGFIAYAIIGGAKKLWAVAEEKCVAKKLAQANAKSVEAPKPEPEEATDDEESGEDDEK